MTSLKRTLSGDKLEEKNCLSYIYPMEFEWDPKKADYNVKNHDIFNR
jgi:hypothetical protein